jgi:hypothetical protein
MQDDMPESRMHGNNPAKLCAFNPLNNKRFHLAYLERAGALQDAGANGDGQILMPPLDGAGIRILFVFYNDDAPTALAPAPSGAKSLWYRTQKRIPKRADSRLAAAGKFYYQFHLAAICQGARSRASHEENMHLCETPFPFSDAPTPNKSHAVDFSGRKMNLMVFVQLLKKLFPIHVAKKFIARFTSRF